MATTASKRSTFILDGKRKTDRTWNERDAQTLPFVLTTDVEDASFGFTSMGAYEAWLTKNGLAYEYAKGKSLLDRAARKVSQKRETELRALQASAVAAQTSDFNERLRKAGISPDDIRGVRKFCTEYDPLAGSPIHSALLYEHNTFIGKSVVLPGHWAWSNFRWIDFNDMCSSARVGGGLFLFADTFFAGRRVDIVAAWREVFNLGAFPYFFNDAASSAIAW